MASVEVMHRAWWVSLGSEGPRLLPQQVIVLVQGTGPTPTHPRGHPGCGPFGWISRAAPDLGCGHPVRSAQGAVASALSCH